MANFCIIFYRKFLELISYSYTRRFIIINYRRVIHKTYLYIVILLKDITAGNFELYAIICNTYDYYMITFPLLIADALDIYTQMYKIIAIFSLVIKRKFPVCDRHFFLNFLIYSRIKRNVRVFFFFNEFQSRHTTHMHFSHFLRIFFFFLFSFVNLFSRA